MEEISNQLPAEVNQLVVSLVSAGMGMAWNGVAALVLFVVGFFAAGFVSRFLRNVMTRARIDATLTSFLTNLLYYGIIALVVITALGKVGVETTQFIAVIGAAGLAVGLALEGALSNFAAGVLIIVFRPFRVGDYVEAAECAGFVEEIEMVYTVLRTLDNEIVILPNSEITGAKIKNLSRNSYVSATVPFVVDHDADLDTVLRILNAAPIGNPHVLAEPAPKVAVVRLDQEGVHLEVDLSVKGGEHEDARDVLVERVKREFDLAGIRPPRQRFGVDLDPGRERAADAAG